MIHIITKVRTVATTQRISVSINKQRAKEAELVTKGAYPSLSAAYDAATEALLEQEAEKGSLVGRDHPPLRGSRVP